MTTNALPSPDEAAVTALRAMAWLARDEERFSRFCQLTGMDAASLRDAAADSGAQVAVLDYLLADETLLLVFVSDEGLPPGAPRLPRMRLGGEDI